MIWLGLALLVVLAVWGARRYRDWRDQRDLRIRHDKLQRFCIVPQAGTKERK